MSSCAVQNMFSTENMFSRWVASTSKTLVPVCAACQRVLWLPRQSFGFSASPVRSCRWLSVVLGKRLQTSVRVTRLDLGTGLQSLHYAFQDLQVCSPRGGFSGCRPCARCFWVAPSIFCGILVFCTAPSGS